MTAVQTVRFILGFILKNMYVALDLIQSQRKWSERGHVRKS